MATSSGLDWANFFGIVIIIIFVISILAIVVQIRNALNSARSRIDELWTYIQGVFGVGSSPTRTAVVTQGGVTIPGQLNPLFGTVQPSLLMPTTLPASSGSVVAMSTAPGTVRVA